ncbi:MAG: DUF2191 domain-containing protein [Deltaproteobacteria bacterium]|nr:DUF2191 domain-containing protein [Deltaproteobacteria bacterium]
MRTTLSLDDDVSATLLRIRQTRKMSLKTIINEALRRGLQQLIASKPRRRLYRTPSVSLGRCLIGNLDDISEALATAEGESFR